MACPEQYTPQGWEWQFATNQHRYIALATGLHDVARYALDPDGAERLWALSQTLLAAARTAAA
jgi:hypothetical protein